MSTASHELSEISRQIWDLKYRLKAPDGTPIDRTIEDTWARVAAAVAEAEPKKARAQWTERFAGAMADAVFLPAGRILAGAGSKRGVTLFNCFVLGRIADDLGSIFENVKEAALTMQQGGGIGHDFSTLRPKGARVNSIGADASGPVSFMDVWDAMCRTIMSAGARRGAMMATLRCDHPDIEAFIDAKADPRRLRNFNLSVLVTDAFISAVRAGDPWDLVFDGRIYRTVPARAVWERLMRATYDYAEPGVIFIDRVNATNNLAYCESIYATNPCGEQPLPPYGACLLGSVNLARLTERPFTKSAAIDTKQLESLVATAIRFLDNVIEISNYPLKAQRQEAKAKRRVGLGVTGLADALILLGLRYDSPEAVARAEQLLSSIKIAAYRASAELAAEKGSFMRYDANKFLAAPNVQQLPPEVRSAIAKNGIRNGLLTSVAPTGTISLLAGNISSGIEPVFDFKYERRVLNADGSKRTEIVEDWAHALFRKTHGDAAPLPEAFVTAAELAPTAHLRMQAAAQRHVDSSISKTINCPADIPFESFKQVYLEAYDLGLKGCTTYRPNPITGAVLTSSGSAVGEPAPDADAATRVPERVPLAGTASEPTAVADRHVRPGEVVYMAEPLARTSVLTGYTYKLKWPGNDHALYITINDMERDGRRRPFEIFINTKNLEHYAWTVALTRMISAIFRRGGDVTFVVEELKVIFDPQGGQWMFGRYVPSLLAAIGGVIEEHMVRTGFLKPPAEQANAAIEPADTRLSVFATQGGGPNRDGVTALASTRARPCPRCNSLLVKIEGCWSCRSCGYSRCT
jgi:ribonucleoside-diphosphate reductase alpha chain